jgi:hypothetical protein
MKTSYKFTEHTLAANIFVVLWLLPLMIISLALGILYLPLCVLTWLPIVLVGKLDDFVKGKISSH